MGVLNIEANGPWSYLEVRFYTNGVGPRHDGGPRLALRDFRNHKQVYNQVSMKDVKRCAREGVLSMPDARIDVVTVENGRARRETYGFITQDRRFHLTKEYLRLKSKSRD